MIVTPEELTAFMEMAKRHEDWIVPLTRKLNRMEQEEDLGGIAQIYTTLTVAAGYIRTWLARAAAEAGVPPPTATESAPALATSETPSEQEAAS